MRGGGAASQAGKVETDSGHVFREEMRAAPGEREAGTAGRKNRMAKVSGAWPQGLSGAAG